MITVYDDGVWCKKCNKFHPTLMWHEKYNNYELNRREEWEKSIEKHFPMYKDTAEFIDSLPIKGLMEDSVEGECEICKDKTFFRELTTKKYVCSDECKYKLLGLKSEV